MRHFASLYVISSDFSPIQRQVVTRADGDILNIEN